MTVTPLMLYNLINLLKIKRNRLTTSPKTITNPKKTKRKTTNKLTKTIIKIIQIILITIKKMNLRAKIINKMKINLKKKKNQNYSPLVNSLLLVLTIPLPNLRLKINLQHPKTFSCFGEKGTCFWSSLVFLQTLRMILLNNNKISL